MPRVMMVVPQYPYPVVGGLERQAHELAKALHESGIDVRVISGKVISAQPSNELVEGIPVRRIPWPPQKWLRFLRTPIDLLLELYIQRKTYGVIHLHQHSWFGLFTILAAKILGKPILTKLPNVGELGLPGLKTQAFGRIKLIILLRSDALVAMSHQSLAELHHAGFPMRRVLAVPNGIQLNGPRQEQMLREVTTARPCRVVFVGRLSEEKLLDVLLVAWRQVMNHQKSNVFLELWGRGPLESELRQRCHEMGLDHSVHFLGHVEQVRDRLAEMDVFVLPSRVEGNSNAILEAMAAGLPIVSTDVGGTSMLVGKEGAAFLCRPGDAEALAANLLALIRDPELRIRIGSVMRRRVEEYFDIHRVAGTYASAYRFLLAGQRERIYEASHPLFAEQLPCPE